MSHHDKLCKIDIPKARAEILKSISDYRKHHRLAEIMEVFFVELRSAKKIDSRLAGKLHTRITVLAPELKVYRVTYSKATGLTGRPEYTFRIWLYDVEQGERSFLLRTLEDDTLNIDSALIADRKWAAHADFLESKLARFAYNAGKFNDMVHALQNMCEEATAPGEHFPVYPLSKFYHWYQLHA